MSVLLIILLVLAVMLLIILIAAAFLKDEYFIERDIIINQSKQQVFDYLKYLKNASQYNKWIMADPDLRSEYTGTDGTIGFISAWDSDNKQVGKGEQQITDIKSGERIDYEIRFEKPFKGTSFTYITTEAISNTQTKVQWIFKGTRNFAMKIFHLLFNLKKVLGKDLDTSLKNLKTILEK
jgi:uncharacterized protein YndB with AHSA1/START domain